MRRSIPKILTKRPLAPVGADGVGEAYSLDLSVPLECITPVIGGGVEAREPAEVDVVRVSGIRGGLRRFWRAVADVREDRLFERETALFGGVGTGRRDGGPDAHPSRVVVTVKIDDPGRCEPAGYHAIGADGKSFKALPQWKIGRELGYALFPLQRTEEERRGPLRSDGLPTRSVRIGLRFTLRVRLRRRSRGGIGQSDDALAEELLAALCAFVHLGGVGARQTRGFGALALQEGARVTGLGVFAPVWQKRFDPPIRAGLAGWLREWGVLGSANGPSPEWFSLQHAYALIGPTDRSAADAHDRLVGALKRFRQGAGTGREARPGLRKEGTSHWPEAQVLRALREQSEHVRWEHPPSAEIAQIAQDPKRCGDLRLPRVAFGLPIVVGFKDREDKKANATIPADDKRFTSPVWLRPVRCRDGYASIVVVHPNRPPADVAIKFKNAVKFKNKDFEKAKFGVRGAAPGAREPIASWLRSGHGDAVEAFTQYLRQEHRFEDLPRGG